MQTAEKPEPTTSESATSRREFARRAAVGAGVVVWSVPLVQTFDMATAAAGSPPPGSATTLAPPEPSSTTTTTTEETTGVGCRTQGYWKNHAAPPRYDAAWDAIGGPSAPFFASGRTHLEILQSPPAGGNAFLTLAHQWIATRLNIAAGAAAPADVRTAYAQGERILAAWSASGSIPKSSADRQRAIDLAATLDAFNNASDCR